MAELRVELQAGRQIEQRAQAELLTRRRAFEEYAAIQILPVGCMSRSM